LIIYYKKIFFCSSVAGRKFFSYCFIICKNFVGLLVKISAQTLATLIICYKKIFFRSAIIKLDLTETEPLCKSSAIEVGADSSNIDKIQEKSQKIIEISKKSSAISPMVSIGKSSKQRKPILSVLMKSMVKKTRSILNKFQAMPKAWFSFFIHGWRKISSVNININAIYEFAKSATLLTMVSTCIVLPIALLKNRNSIKKPETISALIKKPSSLAKSENTSDKNQKIYVASTSISPRRKAKHLFRDPVEIKQRTVSTAILGLKADSVQRTKDGDGRIQIGCKFYSIGAIVNDHPRLKLAKITTNNVKFLDKYGQIYKRKIEDLIE
ncbi:MAG: hypothetical protein LBH49_03805, partial [Puniceicoccales bacterium]|jgi:hypothetical protein|nr:hypothetical protein [Puniceicoccales bacterium]